MIASPFIAPGRKLPSSVILLMMAVWATPTAGAAQIATDRPDFVESGLTVRPGAVQIETSIAYAARGSGALRSASWTTPTLLRWGVGPALELRLETDLWVRDASAPALASDGGLSDVAVGMKWHVLDGDGPTPAAALLVHADLPTGSPALRGEGVRPSLRAVAEWGLPEGFALGVMPGLAVDRSDGVRHVAGIFGLVVGKELTPALRTFGEIAFETLTSADRGGHVAALNTGVAWLVNDRLQLDVALSVGATDAADGSVLAVGFSRLLRARER